MKYEYRGKAPCKLMYGKYMKNYKGNSNMGGGGGGPSKRGKKNGM